MSIEKNLKITLLGGKYYVVRIFDDELIIHTIEESYSPLHKNRGYLTSESSLGENELSIIEFRSEDPEPISIPVERYLMSTPPSVESRLVQDKVQDILQDLDLDALVRNLDNCSDLTYLAFNALNGTKIQAKLAGLQKNLLDLCDDCDITVHVFVSKSQEVLDYIIKTYGMLNRDKPKENIALKNLVRAGERAQEMADASTALAERFKTLSDSFEVVHEETIVEESAQHDKLEQLKNEIAEFKSKIAGNQVLEKQLAEEIEEVNQNYEEAKEEENIQKERQFVLGMVGAFSGALSAGLGAAVKVSNPMSSLVIPGTTSSTTEKPPKIPSTVTNQQKEMEAKSKEYSKARIAIEKARTISDRANAKLEDLLSKSPKKPETEDPEKLKAHEEEVDAYQKELEKAEKDAEEKLADLEEKKNIASIYKDEYESLKVGVSESLKALNISVDKMSDQSSELMKQAHSAKLDFLQQKKELKKQERAVLAELAEYTVKVQSNLGQTSTAQYAVQSLHVAIKCLAKIVTCLTTASLFWNRMASACKSLADSKTVEHIKDFQDEDIEDRLEEYRDVGFMFTLLSYIAGWQALNSVCKAYLDSVRNTRGKVVDNINSAPSLEESRALLPELAERVGASFNEQLMKADETVARMDTEVAEHISIDELNE